MLSLKELYMLRDIYFDFHYKEIFYEGGLYREQILISNAIIEQFINGHTWQKAKDIYVNITRQYWKSTIAFWMIGFLMIFMPKVIWRPITIWVTINKQDQVNKNYLSVRDMLRQAVWTYWLWFAEDSKSTLRLTNWSKLVVFSMEAKNNEWETLDFSIVDEGQALNDEKYDVEIKPMLLRTGWITCYLWVWGYKVNWYYYWLQDTENNLVFKYNCYDVEETVKKYAEEYKDTRHLLYFNWIQKAKEEALAKGRPDQFKTQFELEWKIWSWNFLSIEDFLRYKINYNDLTYKDEKVKDSKSILEQITSLYLGIDWARKWWATWDSSVLTVAWVLKDKVYIIDTFRVQGAETPYPEQVKQMINWLTKNWYIDKVKKIYCDSTWVGVSAIDTFRDKHKWIDIIDTFFSEKKKSELASNFIALYESWKLFYTSQSEKNLEELEKEFKHLELEYKKNWYISYHHPDKWNIHDDYVDSLFLSLLWLEEKGKGWANLEVVQKKSNDDFMMWY